MTKTKTKPTPATWQAIRIPKSLRVTFASSTFLRIELLDRSRFEFYFEVHKTKKLLSSWCFILGWKNERLSFPKTYELAKQLIGKRETYGVNVGFSLTFRHENGFVLLQAFLDELDELLSVSRKDATNAKS